MTIADRAIAKLKRIYDEIEEELSNPQSEAIRMMLAHILGVFFGVMFCVLAAYGSRNGNSGSGWYCIERLQAADDFFAAERNR